MFDFNEMIKENMESIVHKADNYSMKRRLVKHGKFTIKETDIGSGE